MSRVAYHEPLSRVGFRPAYATNPFQAAHRAGLSGVGDVTDPNMGTLGLLGFSAAQVQQIVQAHGDGSLSDAGYQAIVTGQVQPGQLGDFLAQDPGASAPPASSSSGAASNAGVPTGTQLTYSGTWETTLHDSDPQDILRKVTGALSAYGLQVLGSSESVGAAGTLAAAAFIATQFSAQITVAVVGPGFNLPSDVTSIIDHQVYAVTGQMPLASGINVGGGGGALPSGQSLTAWLENNALLIGLGLAAIFVLPDLVKKI